jgi:hypothetical protein
MDRCRFLDNQILAVVEPGSCSRKHESQDQAQQAENGGLHRIGLFASNVRIARCPLLPTAVAQVDGTDYAKEQGQDDQQYDKRKA